MAKNTPATTTAPAVSTGTAATRRLILVGGGKGGVGKSTFTRALCDHYELGGVAFRAFDGDLENPTISRFLDAQPLASQVVDGFEDLVRAMEQGDGAQIIADLGAGTQRNVASFEKVFGLAAAAKDFGYVPVLVWVLAPTKDSIGLLGEAIEAHKAQDGWRLVIVRAMHSTGHWSLWEDSKTKKRVDELNPEVIDFPILKASAFTACDKADLRFKDVGAGKLPYVETKYTGEWFKAVRGLFERGVFAV